MEVYIQDIGKKIKKMDKENINIKMVVPMKENGKIINKMVVVFSLMQISVNMMDNGKMEKNMDKENISILMRATMKVNGNRVWRMD